MMLMINTATTAIYCSILLSHAVRGWTTTSGSNRNVISRTKLLSTVTDTTSVKDVIIVDDENEFSSSSEIILGKDKNIRHHNHNKLPTDRDVLIRAASGLEPTERTPVWLMRQAGRYQKSFREYSNKIPFRERSETPEIAVELSLQCHRTYGMDGIILFSDILTPLPCLGINFDVVAGTGPVIQNKIRTEEDVDALPTYSFDEKTSFISDILQHLSKEAERENTSLIGFIGAPFTLAAYIVEQKSSKHCLQIKKMMYDDEVGISKAASKLLDKLANMIGQYGIYQIEHGAQMIQMFESWAHQVNPVQFEQYVKPAALQAMAIIKAKYPNVPIIYYANGGSSYLDKQRDMIDPKTKANMIGIDWSIDMKTARQILGPNIPISGNVDPAVLRCGNQQQIEAAVRKCIDDAGGPGNYHVLNLGHGVMQNTPEIAIKWFVDEVKRYGVVNKD